MIRDTYLELSPPQRAAYEKAEKEGVVHLNELGDTITVQHVFELVMRLKQICNFDPATGQSPAGNNQPPKSVSRRPTGNELREKARAVQRTDRPEWSAAVTGAE